MVILCPTLQPVLIYVLEFEGQMHQEQFYYWQRQAYLVYTVVWEKFMVRNIREKKIRGKKFSSMQAIDENFLTPNISYMHILTCTLNYHLLFFLL